MAQITKISVQAKNKTRANVFLDDEFVFGADIFTLAKHRIKEGDIVDPAKLDEIIFDAEATSAFERAVNLINLRPRSEKEIVRYLIEKQFSDDVIKAAIAKLKEYRFVDDYAFCEYFISSHRRTRGEKRLQFDLKSYGVDDEIIAQCLEEKGSQEDEAYNLAAKYCRQKGGFDKQKIYTFMFGKGFSSDEIRFAVNKLQEEIDAENE